MAHASTSFESIDLETADLILKLQLEDVQDLRKYSKDKNRDGELSDAQIALTVFEQNLECILCNVSDRRMTQSIANAVQTDGELISSAVREEEMSCEDHAAAHRMNGSNVTCAVQLQAGLLDYKILSKLAGKYISEEAGFSLYKNNADSESQAESSAGASFHSGPTNDLRQVQCIGCTETKRYFDVIEVACGHVYCTDCLQEHYRLASKDESLFPPRCCRMPFDFGQVCIFLTKELKDQFQRAKVEFDTKDRTYCSYGACSAFIPTDNVDGDTARCLKCGTVTCIVCKSNAHDGDCPDDEALQNTLKLAAQNGWQRCYSCHRLLELDTGCNHMT